MTHLLKTLLLFSFPFFMAWASTSAGNAAMETTIPILYLGDPEDIDNTPPSVIKVTDRPDAVKQLQAAVESARPAPSTYDLTEAAKKRRVTFDAVVEVPAIYAKWSPEQWGKSLHGDDAIAMANRMAAMLDDDNTPIANRSQLAIILTNMGDRRGFDWNLKLLNNDDPTDTSGANGSLMPLYFANIHHREWLSGLDLWPLIKSRLDLGLNDEGIGKEIYPAEMQQWYIRQLQRDDLPEYERLVHLNTLSWYAPSAAALEACADMFQKPGPDYEWSYSRRYAETLTRFAEGGNMQGCSRPNTHLRDWIAAHQPTKKELAKIRVKVCEYAANLTGHDHWISREYHHVICAFGDEQWRDYFQQGLNNSQTKYQAFVALARLAADEREQFLRKHAAGFDGQPLHVQSQAISMLCADLAGTRDRELTTLLTNLFHESKTVSDIRIRQLFLIGSTEVAFELLNELRAAHPQPPQPDLAKLLTTLSSFDFPASLTADQINKSFMPDNPTENLPHESFIDSKELTLRALEVAGLRSEVDMIMELPRQLAAFTKMARGEFDVDLVHVAGPAKATLFRYNDCVFQYAVPCPDEYQYPLVESAIANAALQHFENPNRFVPYGNFDGMSEIYFYYGSYQLAKTLQDDFGVEFVPGWEKTFAAQ